MKNIIEKITALGVQLDKHTVGYLTYTVGVQPAMSTSIEHNTEKQHLLVNCTLGIPHSFLSFSYTRKLVDQELKIKLAGKYVQCQYYISTYCLLN